jgi:hypothetical protein
LAFWWWWFFPFWTPTCLQGVVGLEVIDKSHNMLTSSPNKRLALQPRLERGTSPKLVCSEEKGGLYASKNILAYFCWFF